MPCERAEQPLSCSALEDMGVPTLMEIMMAGSAVDICLFACSPQSPGDTWQLQSCPVPEGGCWSPSDTCWPRSCPKPRGHVAAPVLSPAAGAHGGPRAAPSRKREPKLRGHLAASKLPLAGRWEPLSWLEACTRGYPVLRVPTVAPGPTPGEAVNPWVGPTSFSHTAFLSLYVLGF
jgi:hypothetical protein